MTNSVDLLIFLGAVIFILVVMLFSIQQGEENYCKNMEGLDPSVGIYHEIIDCAKN